MKHPKIAKKQEKETHNKQERENEENKQERENEENKQERENEEKEIKYKKEILELTETLQRIQASYENSQKRLEKEKALIIGNAQARIIEQFLPLLDTLSSALSHSKGEQEKIALKPIAEQCTQIFSSLGIHEMKTKDVKFDPSQHDAMMVEENDEKDGQIIEEFQKGYIYNDKIIRHAKVKVGKKKETNTKSK